MKCKQCGKEKEEDEFSRDHRRRIGKNRICRECNNKNLKEYYSKNREMIGKKRKDKMNFYTG